MRIHYFQHVPFEGLGSIGAWAWANEHALTATKFFENAAPPDVDAFDWLVVMGGPMGAGDADTASVAWMAGEKRVIERAIAHGKTVLGICLGAQMIASVLGARVYANAHKEIGWFPIELTDAGQASPLFDFLPRRFDAFHWHGDTFDLPRGAVRIAESTACAQQAFVYAERVVGLQFHLEMTRAGAAELARQGAAELVAGKYIQRADEMLARDEDFVGINLAMDALLARLAQDPQGFCPSASLRDASQKPFGSQRLFNNSPKARRHKDLV